MTEILSQQADQQLNSAKDGGYWEMDEPVKKTLSTASLSGFMKQNDDNDNTVSEIERNDEVKDSTKGKKKENYWEWNDNAITKTLSSLSLSQLGFKRDESESDSEKSKPKNYWFWRNSFKSRSDFMDEDDKGEIEGNNQGTENRAAGGGYWLWRNNSFKKTLSQISLDKQGTGESTPSESDKPLTSLQHKLRNSWRKSFQHLSSNSLSRLDENATNEKKASTWKESMNSFRDSFANLKLAGNSNTVEEDVDLTETDPTDLGEAIEEDAVTF